MRCNWLFDRFRICLSGSATMSRPGVEHCLHESREGDGEKHTQYSPKTTKEKHRDDNRQRVQINHLGEQQRHEHIAIEYLYNLVSG